MSLDHNDPHEVYAYQLYHQYGERPGEIRYGYSIPTKQFLAEAREAAALVVARSADGEPLAYRIYGQFWLLQQDLNALRRHSEHYHNMLLFRLGNRSCCDSRWRGTYQSSFAHAVAEELARLHPDRISYPPRDPVYEKKYHAEHPHYPTWEHVSERRRRIKKLKNKIMKRGQS